MTKPLPPEKGLDLTIPGWFRFKLANRLKSQLEAEMSIVRTQMWSLTTSPFIVLVSWLVIWKESHRNLLKKMTQLSKIKGRTILSLSGKRVGNFQQIIIIPAHQKGLEKTWSNNCFLLTTSSSKKHHRCTTKRWGNKIIPQKIAQPLLHLQRNMVLPNSDFYVALHCYVQPESLLVGNASPHTPCLIPE